jgi:hypothetical protein
MDSGSAPATSCGAALICSTVIRNVLFGSKREADYLKCSAGKLRRYIAVERCREKLSHFATFKAEQSVNRRLAIQRECVRRRQFPVWRVKRRLTGLLEDKLGDKALELFRLIA